MAYALVGAGRGQTVDHINGDRLDNRRANLRLCDRAQSTWNRGPRGGRKFKGVTMLPSGRWQSYITARGCQQYLGLFNTAEEAAAAYDDAARRLHGEFARLNFPERDKSEIHP